MTNQIFATKQSMGQTWTKSGKRLVVSKLRLHDNLIVGEKKMDRDGYAAFQIGFGLKKFKNMSKPLRTILTKGGFSVGVKHIREIKVQADTALAVGQTMTADQVIKVGDMVNVQGTTKGRGFGGVMKRHGFHGGPRTHGQSDRARAPGSIGQRTTPGRVYKGKRMAGHYGNTVFTVKGLQVIHFDPSTQEVWVSGPVPGHVNASVRLSVIGHSEFEGLEKSVAPEIKAVEVEMTEPEVSVDAKQEEAKN